MTSERPVDPASFRRALGRFATGVTVITVQRGEIMHGMTANTFTALSLDPPLVLFCVGKQARMTKLLDGAEGFVVNILNADQELAANQFAGRHEPGTEDFGILKRGPVAPLIPNALVSLSCRLEATHEGGDHWIVVGEVIEIHEPEDPRQRPPLVFFRSRYANLIERPKPVEERVAWANDAIRIYHDEWWVDSEEIPEEEYVRALLW